MPRAARIRETWPEVQIVVRADNGFCRDALLTWCESNQLRLALSTVAYVIVRALRDVGLSDTPLANAQADTIRLKLFKVGTVVRVSVRRVWLALSQSYPWQHLFGQVFENLTSWRRSAIDTG